MGFSFNLGGNSNIFSDLVNGATQAVHGVGNYYGFDNTGKWTGQTGIPKALDEGIGELTGRNQQRHALAVAADAASAAVTQQNQLIQQNQQQKQQQDIQASSGAAAIRATSQAQSQQAFFATTTPQAYGPKLGADTTNFLGV